MPRSYVGNLPLTFNVMGNMLAVTRVYITMTASDIDADDGSEEEEGDEGKEGVKVMARRRRRLQGKRDMVRS